MWYLRDHGHESSSHRIKSGEIEIEKLHRPVLWVTSNGHYRIIEVADVVPDGVLSMHRDIDAPDRMRKLACVCPCYRTDDPSLQPRNYMLARGHVVWFGLVWSDRQCDAT